MSQFFIRSSSLAGAGATVLLAAALVTPVLAVLPGLPAPAPAAPTTTPAPAAPEPTAQNVRPTAKPEKAAVVAATGTIRGSLFKQGAMTPIAVDANGQQIGGVPVSFTAVVAPKPKKYQKNDIITVIVAVNSTSATTSQGNSEKKQDYDLALQQFVKLAQGASGIPSLSVVAQPSQLPEAKFHYDNNRQNTADQQRSDTVSDRFAAVVVDVKPNGTMVLEATQQVAMDREVLHYKMSGICRAADVTQDNTILSTQLADLNLSKQTSGEVRDGVKSGWFNKFLDKVNPL